MNTYLVVEVGKFRARLRRRLCLHGKDLSDRLSRKVVEEDVARALVAVAVVVADAPPQRHQGGARVARRAIAAQTTTVLPARDVAEDGARRRQPRGRSRRRRAEVERRGAAAIHGEAGREQARGGDCAMLGGLNCHYWDS